MKNKWKQAPWYGYVIVGLMCLGIFLPNFAQYQVTSLADRLRTEMGLSQSQYGSIATAPLLAGIILSFLSGLLMDRFGHKVLLAAVFLTVGGVVLRAFTSGYWFMYISMLLMGFSASFVNSTTPKVAGAWFPASKVTAMMGLVLAFSNLGMALGSGTAPQFPTTQAAFRFAAGLAVVVLILWLLLNAEKKGGTESSAAEEEAEERASFRESVTTVLRNKGLWFVALCNIGMMLGMLSNTIFMPQALMSRGLTEGEAGWYAVALTMGNMITSIVSPAIVRRIGTTGNRVRWIMRICGLMGGILEATAWLLPKGPALAAGLFATGFIAVVFLPFLQSMPAYLEGIGRKYAATATGTAMTLQLLCCVIIPSYIVAPIAGDNYLLLFGLMAAMCILPILFSALVPFERLMNIPKTAARGKRD